MARTVAFSQHGSEPKWLELGKAALAVERRAGGGSGWASKGSEDLDARTAKRYARIAEFLENYYPDYFSGKKPFRAGSAIMLDFMKLHQEAPEHAKKFAERCFSGELTVTKLKLTLQLVRPRAPQEMALPGTPGSRRYADFEALVKRRLKAEMHLLEEADLIDEVRQRGALLPDILVHHKNGQVTAMDIKAPTDTSARSIVNVSSSLVARIAALRLKYDDAILVLPEEAKEVAEQTISLWQKWVDPSKPTARPISILLLGTESHGWLTSDATIRKANL